MRDENSRIEVPRYLRIAIALTFGAGSVAGCGGEQQIFPNDIGCPEQRPVAGSACNTTMCDHLYTTNCTYCMCVAQGAADGGTQSSVWQCNYCGGPLSPPEIAPFAAASVNG